MIEEYMIRVAFFAAGILSLVVLRGVYVWYVTRKFWDDYWRVVLESPSDEQLKQWARQSEQNIMNNNGKYTITKDSVCCAHNIQHCAICQEIRNQAL